MVRRRAIDVALETADVALMGDDLRGIPRLIRIARKAGRILRFNIAFAIVVKAAFVCLTIAGVATLWMAVLADMGASLIVIANGLRALNLKEREPLAPGVGSGEQREDECVARSS